MRTRSYRTAERKRKHRGLEAIGAEPCAIPRCREYAVETLRLLVNGTDSALPVCQIHAEWIGRYIGTGGPTCGTSSSRKGRTPAAHPASIDSPTGHLHDRGDEPMTIHRDDPGPQDPDTPEDLISVAVGVLVLALRVSPRAALQQLRKAAYRHGIDQNDLAEAIVMVAAGGTPNCPEHWAVLDKEWGELLA